MLFNNLKKYGSGDPEFLVDRSGNSVGNGATYPNMKTLNVGLNLTF